MKKTNTSVKLLLNSMALATLSLLFFCNSTNAQNKDGEIKMPEQFTSPYIFINNCEITGNDRTKDKILIRELDFALGDSLSTTNKNEPSSKSINKRFVPGDSSEVSLKLKFSRENIINTSLFLDVHFNLVQVYENNYTLKIDVKERWYFWIFPVVSIDAPNFNDWAANPDVGQLNQGLFTSHNNLWGLGHQTSIIGYGGSSSKIGWGYHIPWVGKGQKIGLKAGLSYESKAIIEYGSVDNKRQMLFDKNSVDEWSFATILNFRPGLYNYSSIKLSVENTRISDSLYQLAPNFLPDSAQEVFSVSLYVDYAYDSRNSKAYPLQGNYLKGFLDKKGLGMLTYDVDYFFYGIDFHFYQKLSKKFYVAEMVKAVSGSSGDIAYNYKQNLTANGNFVRGFDLNAIRGDKMYYFRGNFKYELIAPNVYTSKRKPESKFRNVQYAFYLNAFSDYGYAYDNAAAPTNPYNNKSLYSWGLGLDFVSYYNLVMRFEYAFTSMHTHGFFFGFGMPI